MAEKGKLAYRKRGSVAVYCRAIEGDSDYCVHQYLCPASQRWEANSSKACTHRGKQPIK